jgi:hypothetical protein
MTLSLLTCLLVTICGFAMAASSHDVAEPLSTAAYQLTPEQLEHSKSLQEVSTAVVEYRVGPRVLRSERTLFQALGSQLPEIRIADPRLLGLEIVDITELQIDVMINGTLVDSFGIRGLAQLATRGSLRDATGAETQAKAIDQCQLDCMQSFISCYQSCVGDLSCEDWCRDDNYSCLLGCPFADVDHDGVQNYYDNCIEDANADQANCDGDSWGDVCDSLNALYQVVIPDQTCMTDKDTHFPYFTFEHHVEKKEHDVSSCGAPDRWSRRIREDNDCINISDFQCCIGLDASITAVGDSTIYWCDAAVRNIDFCH